MPHQRGKNTLKLDATRKGGSMQLKGWNALPAGWMQHSNCVHIGWVSAEGFMISAHRNTWMKYANHGILSILLNHLQVQKESIQLFPPSTIFLTQEFKHVNWWPSKWLCCSPCNPRKRKHWRDPPEKGASLLTCHLKGRRKEFQHWILKWIPQGEMSTSVDLKFSTDWAQGKWLFQKKEAFHIFSSFLRSYVETFHKSTSQQENF